MRRRIPSIAFVFLTLPLAALASVSACGGDDNKGDGGPDATTDAPPDVAKLEAGPDVVDAGCANDADLTQYLPSADASIDVDAGLNIAACTGCLKDSCGTQINSCNSDCDCRQGVIDFVTCIAQNQAGLSTCVSDALGSGNQDLINLVSCAGGKCLSVCLPGDGGTPSDAGSDAGDASGD